MRATSPSVNTYVKASNTIGATLPCTNLHYDMGEIQLAVHYEIEAEGFVRLVDPMDQVQHLETEVGYEDILESRSRDCESIDLFISASRCDVAEARSPERILSQSIDHHDGAARVEVP
jgi:signal recognition particle receptor subunit beta